MHQNVARCRDGDVSLKYDAAECSPGCVSMKWYPSLFLDAAECSPRCSWSFFTSWFFHAGTCSSETHGTIPTSLLVFVESVFTLLVSLLFLECKLHCGTSSLALKEAVLTAILHMPFDVAYYLVLLLLYMSTWVVEHGMVPLLVPEVFPPVDFSMQAHVFFGDTWHHPYISTCFCGKSFYFPCFFTLNGVQAAIWQFQSRNLGSYAKLKQDSDASHMQPCT